MLIAAVIINERWALPAQVGPALGDFGTPIGAVEANDT